MAAITSSLKHCGHKYKILQTTSGQNNSFILYKVCDFHSNVAENSNPLGYDIVSMVNHILNFRGKIVSSPSRVDMSKKIFPAQKIRTICCLKTSGSDYPHMQCHFPGKWSPQLQAYTKFRQHTQCENSCLQGPPCSLFMNNETKTPLDIILTYTVEPCWIVPPYRRFPAYIVCLIWSHK
jgi:hypothetical protein